MVRAHPQVSSFLARRASTPSRTLTAPGPDSAQLRALLTLAVRVPDHGKLSPWRFLVIAGGARERMGQLLVRRKFELEPEAAPAALAKEAERFSFAPVIVTVIARVTPGHKVPEREQLLSAGAVAHQLLLASEAAGWGAQWLTGWAAYDPVIAAELGLAEHESVVGFLHIGTATEPAPQRPRPDVDALTSHWSA